MCKLGQNWFDNEFYFVVMFVLFLRGQLTWQVALFKTNILLFEGWCRTIIWIRPTMPASFCTFVKLACFYCDEWSLSKSLPNSCILIMWICGERFVLTHCRHWLAIFCGGDMFERGFEKVLNIMCDHWKCHDESCVSNAISLWSAFEAVVESSSQIFSSHIQCSCDFTFMELQTLVLNRSTCVLHN